MAVDIIQNPLPLQRPSEISWGFGDHRSQGAPWQKTAWKACVAFSVFLASTAFFTLFGGAVFGSAALALGLSLTPSIGAGIGSGGAISIYLLCRGIQKILRRVPDTAQLQLPDYQTLGAPRPGELFTDRNGGVVVSPDGIHTHQWRLAMIGAARQSIEFSAGYGGGRTFDELLTALEAASERRVRVKLLVTDFFLSDSQKERMQQIKQREPSFDYIIGSRDYSYYELQIRNNHAKFLVTDGKYWALGGNNATDDHTCSGLNPPSDQRMRDSSWKERYTGVQKRDMELIGFGKMAQTMRLEFHRLWAIWEYKERNLSSLSSSYLPIDENAPVAMIPSLEGHQNLVRDPRIKLVVGDPDARDNAIQKVYTDLIRGARNSIQIANMQFAPVPEILNALCVKGREGKRIEVITNGPLSFSPLAWKIWGWSNRYHAALLARQSSQCSLLEYSVPNSSIHQKEMIVDGEKCIVGSYNFGLKSDEGNHEAVIVAEDPRITSQVIEVFNQSRRHSSPWQIGCSYSLMAPINAILRRTM